MIKSNSIFFRFIVISALVMSTEIIYAQTLLYRITKPDKEFNKKVEITKTESAYLVKTSYSSSRYHCSFNTDMSFAIQKTDFIWPEKGINVSAQRVGDKIIVTGQVKDKAVNEEFDTDGLPWYQEWSWGLTNFILSDKETMTMLTLDSKKFTRITKFQATKVKTEIIEVNGEKVESVRVQIRLSGILKYAWSGDMWFRKSDGVFLLSKMKDEAGGSIVFTELIKEN